jgi:HD-GYP domain-containing protein (c-di-GMP phosphodiesterase class II)
VASDRFLKAFLASLKSTGFYSPEHPACVAAFQELAQAAAGLLQDKDSFYIGVVGKELVINGIPQFQQISIYARIVELLHRRGIEKMTFARDLAAEELKILVLLLPQEGAGGGGDFNRQLQEVGVTHITTGRLSTGKSEAKADQTHHFDLAEQNYASGLEAIQEINHLVRERRVVKGGDVSSLARMLVRGIRENQGTLMTILNLHSKDEYTATHCLDVALLTMVQASRLRLDEGTLAEVAAAGLLHDLGKLLIPDEVLNKKGPLDPAEWELMREHPRLGAELIHGIPGVGDLAYIAAYEHHIRLDHSGYPPRRRTLPLHSFSLMVAIADVYDAMRSRRSYQDEQPPEKAAGVLFKGAGTHFHPVLVRRFLDEVGTFGLGSVVSLDSGEVAVVVANNPGWPSRPVVQVIMDEAGREVGGKRINTADDDVVVSVERSLPVDGSFRDRLRDVDFGA